MHDSRAHVLILPLAVIGGLGLPVLMELFDFVRAGRRISYYSRAVLALAAGVYVLALIPLLHQQWPAKVPDDSTLARELREPLISSSTTALNTRTLGWPMQSPARWPRGMQWVVILLMLIGAAPASTGGGLKTTCLLELWRGTRRALASSPAGRIFGIAVVWLGLYLLLILITTMRLSASEPQLAADQILFIVTSAIGNVGLSPAPISITGDGLYTLSITMVLGRVLPLCILWWAALTTGDAELAVA
jgi:trk system potassium uptake protein TrkH